MEILPGTTWNAVQSRVQVGDHFAFFEGDCLASTELEWLHQWIAPPSPSQRVVPLQMAGPVALPGARHHGGPPVTLGSAVLTSDKTIYETFRDTVHLLVSDPCQRGRKAVVEIRLEGNLYQRQPLVLNDQGLGPIQLTHLPAGNFSATVITETETSPTCDFVVAEYRLVPLVAHFLERQADGQSLRFTLSVQSYGIPFEGLMSLVLLEKDQVLSQHEFPCQDGALRGCVDLRGEGPFSLRLQPQDDPQRTASVPIVGSRLQEREKTLLSELGKMVEASLLPSAQSVEVRGLHLEEGPLRNSPIRLERVDSDRVELVACADLEGLAVTLVDPTFPGLAAEATKLALPNANDLAYRQGYALYRQGKYVESCAVFERYWLEAALKGDTVHPYYAYNAACCQALLGNSEVALLWLERSLRDGLKDWKLVREDADFASLAEHPRFQHLRQGGMTTHRFDSVKAGQRLELANFESMTLVSLGAFLEGKPWEARALTLRPSKLKSEVRVEEQEGLLEVHLEVPEGASAYVVVKDARLLSSDTPCSRLAGRLKGAAALWQALPRWENSPPTLAKLREKEEERRWPVPPDGRAQFSSHSLFEAARASREEDSWWSTPASDPFATPTGSHAFGSPGRSADPFGGDPFGASQSNDPFASADPFASDPFGAPVPFAADPFGGADPFAASASADPFAAPAPFASADPFAAAADPFASPAPVPLEAAPAPTPSMEAPKSAVAIPKKDSPRQPETFFAGLVQVSEGRARVRLHLPPECLTLQVEVLVAHNRDWQGLEARHQVQVDPILNLQVTPFVQPGDSVFGRLEVLSASGRNLEVQLRADGQEVALSGAGPSWQFPLQPGLYQCQVRDSVSGESWTREARVQAPGQLVSAVKVLQLLQPGDFLECGEESGILGLEVLPGLDQPFRLCLHATANYGHACCEQTAAKMVAACALWVFGKEEDRAYAEGIIQAGVRRLETMWLPRRGFKMYPESSPNPDSYWGPKAARYLWVLQSLQSAPGLKGDLEKGLKMAEDASRAYGIAWPPQIVKCYEDAYWALRYQPEHPQAREYLGKLAVEARGVQGRIEAAYAAAAMILINLNPREALSLANQVTRQFNAEGRLYSTADSVAAISLMMTMKQRGFGTGTATLETGGQTRSSLELVGRPLKDLRVQQGLVTAQVQRLLANDWTRFESKVPFQVSLQRGNEKGWRWKAGDSLDLVVELEKPYQVGDLVWVCLPDCLSRVVGGGQLKLFSVDLEGHQKVHIALAVTGHTGTGRQHFAVCVRNMYDEERVGNPGLLSLTVAH